MTLFRFECPYRPKTHESVLVSVDGGMAHVTIGQVTVPCPDCGRKTEHDYL